jgi:hypothetical protein
MSLQQSEKTQQGWPPRLTRQMLGPFLRDHGIPVGDSTITKLCSPKVGRGPHPSVCWGHRFLYDPAAVLEWAERQLRPVSKRRGIST